MPRLCLSNILQLLVVCGTVCDAAKILGIAPFEARSHIIIMSSLFKELAKRGHQMTVLTVLPDKEVPSNYSQIPVDITHFASGGGIGNMFDMGQMHPLILVSIMWSMSKGFSEMLLENQNVQKLLHSDENFDLIITENFFNQAILGLSHKFNVPFVSVATFSGTEDMKDAVGDPFPYSYIPNIFLHYSNHMTFLQRLYNTILCSLVKLGNNFYFVPTQDSVMRKYFSHVPNLPPLQDIIRNTSLLLLNTHFSFGSPRPTVPNSVEVGGMHIKPPKKLPQDIQKFLDEAQDGVIYFSMGSNLKSADMSVSKRESLLKAFSRIKLKVLWKFEEELRGVPENVKISKWFPQSDILAHPNIRVFMTHGGLLSSQEAIYNAVPLIGIPIFADQVSNVFQAANTGYALHLDYQNITEDSVYWALNEVLNNPKFKQIAERMSKVFHDQPETPMERAVYWIEYVLRHKGARHLRSAALDLTWYEYYLIDVVAFLLAACVAALMLLVWMIRALAAILRSRTHHRTSQNRKKTD